MTTHLSELVAHRLAPASPTPSSSLVTFVLALYVERTVSTLALVLVEQIASIVARRSSVDQVVATVQDLEVAFKEDERVWSWVGEFNVRNLIEFPGGANESSASAAARRHRRRESINPTTLEQGPPHKVVVGSEPTLESVHATRGGGGVPVRRASVDSYKSANNGFGFIPTRDANVARHVQQQHRRKPSLALSVVQSLNSTSLVSLSSSSFLFPSLSTSFPKVSLPRKNCLGALIAGKEPSNLFSGPDRFFASVVTPPTEFTVFAWR